MNTPVPARDTSLIHGTHRPQDLIPTMLDAVRQYCPEEYAGMMATPYFAVPSYVYDEGDSCPWWHSEDAVQLLEVLFDLLMGVAPEGCYFGAHPGDGSDFGWWADDV